MKKINNKGYLTIEIILAATIAFTIAFFLIEVTIDFSNASDNYYTETIFITDKALVSNNVKKNIQNDINENGIITNVSCNNNTCTITYNNNTNKELKYNSSNKKVEYNTYNKEVKNLTFKNINVYGNFNEGDYIRFVISFNNTFTKNNYDINILIYNGDTEDYEYLVDHIVDLYNDNKDTTVINNNIEYQYATEVNLMNDRLGGATEDLDGGNIRYYGATPNNYIDIGDRTSDGNVILWRVIGVFDNKIRIIRNDYLENVVYDSSPRSGVSHGYGVNEWSQADIMKLLNPGYENNKDEVCHYYSNNYDDYLCDENVLVNNSLWWNKEAGLCYAKIQLQTSSCDFTSNGLSDTAKEKIIDSKIYLGGSDFYEAFPNEVYLSERGNNVIQNPRDGVTRTTEWTGKVGLMYPSDFGYAVDLSKCDYDLSKYNLEKCQENWLGNYRGQYFITPSGRNGQERSIWYAMGETSDQSGYVRVGDNITGSPYSSIRPVVTLNQQLVITKGDGSEDNPYVVKMDE